MCIAAMYSPGVGIGNSRSCLTTHAGADGAAAGTSAGAATASTFAAFGVSLMSVFSFALLAATCVTFACGNAPNGTNDNSTQRADATTNVPLSSNSASIGSAPTLTASNTPSLASSNASLPAAVLLIRATKYTPFSSSARSVTTPIAAVKSWFCTNLGAGPSTGSEPGKNLTVVPSATVASTLYGAATPMISRRPALSPSAACSCTGLAVNLIMAPTLHARRATTADCQRR